MYPMISDLGNATRTLFEAATKYGGTFQIRKGSSRVIVPAGPGDIVDVLHNGYDFPRADFVNKIHCALAPNGLVTMSPESHKHARKFLAERFSNAHLHKFEEKMNEAVAGLCDYLQAAVDEAQPEKMSGVVDISRPLNLTTFQAMCNIGFDASLYRENLDKMAASLEQFLLELMTEYAFHDLRNLFEAFGTRKKLFELHEILAETCKGFLQKRRTESKETKEKRPSDLLDAIIDLSDGDDEVLLSVMKEFALASFGSSGQAIAWTIYEVCCNRRVEKELIKELREHFGDRSLDQPILTKEVSELAYVNKIWKEVLRKHASAITTTKQAQKSMTLKGSGYHVPKGALIVTFTAWAQMNPHFWKEPEEFRPERFGHGLDRSEAERAQSGAYVPFAAGPYSCPGRHLANYEGPLIIAELFRRFTFELATDMVEVVSKTSFVEMPRSPSVPGGKLDRGLQVRVGHRAL